jgi:hypothetical protein
LDAFLAKNGGPSHPCLRGLPAGEDPGIQAAHHVSAKGPSSAQVVPPLDDDAFIGTARFHPAVDLITQDPSLAIKVATPRPLHELGRELWQSTKLSYDQIVALSDYSYWSKGETPPAQSSSRLSLDRLLSRLFDVWEPRGIMRSDGTEAPLFRNPVTNDWVSAAYHIYETPEVSHPLPGSTPGDQDARAAELHRAAFNIVISRPEGSKVADLQFDLTYQRDVAPGDQLIDSLSEAIFISFYRAGADSAVATKRISINASRELGHSLMKGLVNDVIDKPGEFPGVYSGKIGNPRWERPDSIIMYLADDAAVTQVIDWLKTYQNTGDGRDAFYWDATPTALQVLAGVGIGEEPPRYNAFGSTSFGGYRAHPIDWAVVRLPRDGSVTREQFVAAAHDVLSDCIDLGQPHLNKPAGS